MLDLAFSVVWLLVVMVAILDQHLQLKAVRNELAQERAEAAKERVAAAQRHMNLARVSQEQHVEMLCILRANIVPDRVSGGIDACTETAPATPREPAITRSQRPPAPVLDWKTPGVGPPDGETSFQS
jgi:hypothetical protein